MGARPEQLIEPMYVKKKVIEVFRADNEIVYEVRRYDDPAFEKGRFSTKGAAMSWALAKVLGETLEENQRLRKEAAKLQGELEEIEESGAWCGSCACSHCHQKQKEQERL